MEPFSEVSTITMTTAASSSSCSIPLDEKKSARKMKPYGCVMCRRAFSKALKLQKHMMEAHGLTEESDDDEEDDEVVEEEDRDDAGHIERQDEDGINLFADAAASVLGDFSGESRDTDDSLSHSHPTENSQTDRQTDADHRDTEPKVDSAGTNFTTQRYSAATIQAALQLNPSDIIAQAAAGANILVDEKDVHVDVPETQSVHLDTGVLIVAEIDGFSHDPDDARKDDTHLFFDPSPQDRPASSPEDRATVQTDREESQCSETISQMFPVLLHQPKSSSKIVRPEPRITEESAETSKATDDSYREDCVGGEMQSKNWQEKKIPKSSRCRQRSCQIASSNNKPSSSKKLTLKGSAQVSGTAKEQVVGSNQRPHLRRSRRSAKRKLDKDFLTESEEGKEKQVKKQKREEKRKDEKTRRQKEQKRTDKKTDEEVEITSRELPETSQECEGTGTKKKRRTLKEKLADLQKAHEETEKLNILVQQIISDSSDGKTAEKKSLLTCLKRKSLSRKSKAKMSKTYDCLSCREKFPSLSECIDHMRKAHLSSKERCQVESEEPSSSDISSEEDDEEDNDEDVGEMRKTNQNSSPTKAAKRLQNGKASGRGGEYSCKYCIEISKSVEGQRAHMSVHCGLVEGKCFKCKIYESRPSAAQIEDIERSVEKVRETTDSDGYEFKQGKRLLVQFFQCIVCNSCFAVEKHLRNHMSQHKVIVCQVCSGVFSSTQALGKHIPHHKTGPLSCKTCGQTFFSSYMLLMHMRGHTKDFRCKHCDAPFMFRGNLLRHIRQRHTDKTDCDPASADNAASQHERLSKNKGQSKLNCRFCGNLHCSEVTLKRHIETYHPERVEDRGKFVCELCGAVRHKLSQLKAHMICHNQPKQKCQLCSKVFLRPASLKQHIQQVHAGRKDYTCQYCGKRISSSTSLQDHERLHTGEKPYVCLECGKSFRIRQSYKTHLKTKHSKEKPFGCPQCGKCFFSCKSLAKHQRIHTPNEDSVCPDCGKQFKRKDLLRLHLVQHRQVLKCFKCNRCFSSEVALKYHTNKAHKINLYRTNYVHINLPEGPLHTSQPQISSTVQGISPVSDAPGDFSTISTSPDKNPIPVTMLNGTSKDVFADASVNSIVGVLSTPVAMEPSNNLPRPYGTDRRLSDPTNVAISTILSQLFERTISSVPE